MKPNYFYLSQESAERVLHPTKVLSIQKDMIAVELEEPELAVETGQEILIYYKIKQKFMRQPARIDALLETEQSPTIGLATTGEPMSAESR